MPSMPGGPPNPGGIADLAERGRREGNLDLLLYEHVRSVLRHTVHEHGDADRQAPARGNMARRKIPTSAALLNLVIRHVVLKEKMAEVNGNRTHPGP